MRNDLQPNPHADHRERVKERFEREGLDHFPDHNVLEFLLFFAIPRKDTNEIAHRLLDRFGSLSAVMEASVQDLCGVEGVGEHAAILLRSYPPVAKRYFQDRFSLGRRDWDYDNIGTKFVLHFAGMNDEEVYAIFFDNSLAISGEKVLYRGSVNGVGFSARKVAEACVDAKASYMVLAHNHPHGAPFASRDDLDTTKRLRDFLMQMGVTLIDHFIVAEGVFTSLGKQYFNSYVKERDRGERRMLKSSDEISRPFVAPGAERWLEDI